MKSDATWPACPAQPAWPACPAEHSMSCPQASSQSNLRCMHIHHPSLAAHANSTSTCANICCCRPLGSCCYPGRSPRRVCRFPVYTGHCAAVPHWLPHHMQSTQASGDGWLLCGMLLCQTCQPGYRCPGNCAVLDRGNNQQPPALMLN